MDGGASPPHSPPSPSPPDPPFLAIPSKSIAAPGSSCTVFPSPFSPFPAQPFPLLAFAALHCSSQCAPALRSAIHAQAPAAAGDCAAAGASLHPRCVRMCARRCDLRQIEAEASHPIGQEYTPQSEWLGGCVRDCEEVISAEVRGCHLLIGLLTADLLGGLIDLYPFCLHLNLPSQLCTSFLAPHSPRLPLLPHARVPAYCHRALCTRSAPMPPSLPTKAALPLASPTASRHLCGGRAAAALPPPPPCVRCACVASASAGQS